MVDVVVVVVVVVEELVVEVVDEDDLLVVVVVLVVLVVVVDEDVVIVVVVVDAVDLMSFIESSAMVCLFDQRGTLCLANVPTVDDSSIFLVSLKSSSTVISD